LGLGAHGKPGAGPSELAAEIGIAPGQVSALLAKARHEKLVVKGRWLRAETVVRRTP
jgi:hypothetical protein